MTTAVVRLKKPLTRVLRLGHPWIYERALAPPLPPAGTPVTVVDPRGKFVGRGFADGGPIGVRMLTTHDEPLDDRLLALRMADAAELRDRVLEPGITGYRLVHGEGDRLPGLVCDIYDETAVVRFDGDGATAWMAKYLSVLDPILVVRGVENVLVRIGRRGKQQHHVHRGCPPTAAVTISEGGLRLVGDVVTGQKTGFFLDHRVGRKRVRELSAGLRVLDLYAYVGGFSAAAGLGGAAAVTTVDIAAPAIESARATWVANGLDSSRQRAIVHDVPDFLAREREEYGLVIADPPSFAPSEAALPRALRSYRALHEAALLRIAPRGFYLAASCSSHVTRHAFEETLLDAARRARKVVQILERWGAPADHPRLLAFPEGDYLKVVLARCL